MVVSKKNVTVSVAIDKDVKVLLEKYSKDLDLTLSKFARNLIYIALDDMRFFHKTGITKLVLPFRSLLETIPGYKEKVDARVAKKAAESVTISVVIDTDVKELLDEIANETGLTLKTFARNLIYVALDDFKLLKKIGVIRLAVAFRDFLETFQNYAPEDQDRALNK